jgi:dTDP-4-amino-4,6-dideoxygalactose transaminase
MNGRPVILGGDPILSRIVPLTRPHIPAAEPVIKAFRKSLKSGVLTKGDQLKRFEQELQAHLSSDYVVAVSSCTTGLMLALQALGLTGEVILPSFTFSATAAAIVWNGLTPVFVDCDPDTFTIDVDSVQRAINPRTSAIVAVHVFGNPAPIEKLEWVAAEHGLALVFDAAHGFGTLYQGRTLGSNGDVEVFSCSPTKLLAAGEGGVVATRRADVAEMIRTGREYGNPGDYNTLFAGMNGRMSEFHAALGTESLKKLDWNAEKRNDLAKSYKKRLHNLPGLSFQKVAEGNRCSYKDFGMVVNAEEFGLSRNELAAALAPEGVNTRAYYDPPVHMQAAYSAFSRPSLDLNVTDHLANSIICLPMSSDMTKTTVSMICECICRIHAWRDAIRNHVAEKRQAA